ncbi:MAG: bifunctional demethylmenaquinone methyltransferase/2-methoxy-6-polyprenyl-1,4-benzoquinol methylase UbiE [Candidatus Marisimplicoccus sp.]|jgi:demethylmenaquinone methyltransferase/2-methoxy-6-polyprenyl-1,4-benzoquinol methylase|nr:MAG: bifunctional demethylmenaquinone methyltransferase/2-methoxy-6-polyprenyl-1,4-benzoquinol methylase UbiE [Flavobacteriales bacterium]|tara:strand:- start:2199 stop:2903 length:705 start_codon:yes stop_codon:yes gene_type:complete
MTKIQKSEESYIKNIFESISKDYDLMNDLITFKYHSKWKKEIAMIAKEDNPKVILDIATGTGDIAINLSKLKDSQIIGVDISEKMLDVAGDKIRKMNITNITLELSKAEKLKYKNNFFDLISIGYGVRNFEDLINGLKESYRVLKKNGKLIILETSVPNNFLIKYLYLLFTSIYVPLISFIFTKNIKAYNYLLDSTKEFPHEKEFKKILGSVGFKNIASKKKFFGISTIYILTK